jgi:hypothetical protein
MIGWSSNIDIKISIFQIKSEAPKYGSYSILLRHHTHARIPLCYRENFPVLVSKTPVLSEPSFGEYKKINFDFYCSPFAFNPCGRKTCILVSVIINLASTSVDFPLEELT